MFVKNVLPGKLLVLIFREPKDIRKIRKQKTKVFLLKLTKEELLKIRNKFIKIFRIITLNFILILTIYIVLLLNRL